MVSFTVIDWGKCPLVTLVLIKMIRTKLMFVPVVLYMAGVLSCVCSGCKRSDDRGGLPSNSPEVYMKDKAFRAAVEGKAKELRAIQREREPLLTRMKELFKQHGEDLSKLQQVEEWQALHKKIVDLNAKYEQVRSSQLKQVGEKLLPENLRNVSK